jgi:2,5-diketo-D-gluconate reductase A
MPGSTPVPEVELHDGVAIPQLGFGVFLVPPAETQAVVEEALEVGYRHFDTAAVYANEEGVGAAIAASGIPREELFITTKLWNADHGHQSALDACARSLELLGLEQLDLYLIHWPVPAADRYMDAWRAFEELRAEGRSRSIGVSNFRLEELERLQREADHQPTLNQVELHPYLQQPELRLWHAEHGVATEAWSPIAHGAALRDRAVATIAEHHERTPAQAILRWQIQLGNVAIPKSMTPARIRENFAIFDFELSEDEMAAIGALDRGERIGPDPATLGSR